MWRKAAFQPSFQWAVGGWAFFIAENLILSENRSCIIEQLGEDGYHIMYGLCSTAACSSIGYAYLKKVKQAPPLAWSIGAAVPVPMKAASFLCYALGFGLLSQIPPKFQMPIIYNSQDETETKQSTIGPTTGNHSSAKRAWKVRCPFDFTDSKSKVTGQLMGNGCDIHGLDRISRHPGLWSMGLIGLGQAFLVPSIPQRAWLCMPILVAAIGGWHSDSRHRRGMGGHLIPSLDEQTSNVPFLAMILGKQENGDVVNTFKILAKESKGLNAVLGVGLAALMVRRGG
eukprot:CAMPEP_0113934358 /NCGR_PEP_ID=MMETSP1339-20121228/1694_1 /TAXON_ID=94617 /ORGANISM="Fibrocapsa japonica" /LENGTH=284 /DNA_ID=CAMNT_0000936135 /DNA_START=105 /DNA_END=956 /DNA_ORIENTATION=+ /assembly_acc=CAM_ASM_000762